MNSLRLALFSGIALLLLAPLHGAAPAGTPLLGSDPRLFSPAIWVEDKAGAAKVEVVPAVDRPFAEALKLTAFKPSPESWQIGASAKTTAPIKKGDVLWVTFQSRRIESRQETGEAIGTITLLQKNSAGREVRPLERGFSCGLEWIETSIPFVAEENSEPGTAALAIRFGNAIQSLEVGGVTLINCGPNAKIAELPMTITRYEGHAADAPWRAAANERIERIRKGDLKLLVTDTSGQPVKDAQVAVRMKRHAFAWGTAIDSKPLLAQTPDSARYRETIEKYFNKVVFENELKWGRWMSRTPEDSQRTLQALDWLDARQIPVRGHVMIWPSWRQTPKMLKAMENDPEKLRATILDHIKEQTAALGNRLTEWDVINETFQHHDIPDLLGREVMVDWFRAAHAGAPNVKLFYNDYTMFQGTGPGSPSQYFYDVIQFFKDHDTPISGIGEQGHFGGNPPGPDQILATLDRFQSFGIPIQISEYDIDTPDAGLQADFTRDFTTVLFSHPAVTGMVHWGFWAGAHWKSSAALWNKDWTLRPAGQAWVDLVSKTWWTNADGPTGADGTYATRGFYGDYEVTVTSGTRTATQKVNLAPGSAQQTLVLP